MANSKISALTSATTPLAGTEVLPIVQSSATVKVATNDLTVRNVRAAATTGILQVSGPTAASTRTMTVPDANFTAARTDAAQSFTGDQTLATGNIIQGTAAKGFNFTANTPVAGMTSQLLNWYEEGTWTPALTFDGLAVGATYGFQTGYYTRIGRQVLLNYFVSFTNKGSSTGNLVLSGFPHTTNANCRSTNIADPITGLVGLTTGGAVILSNSAGSAFAYFLLQTTTARITMTDANCSNTSRFGGSFSYFI